MIVVLTECIYINFKLDNIVLFEKNVVFSFYIVFVIGYFSLLDFINKIIDLCNLKIWVPIE